MAVDDTLSQSVLGKTTVYESEYNPKLLFPIPRQLKRDEIGVPEELPFTGWDIWNGYELSWLNLKGKPQVAVATFAFPAESKKIVESKSFKLYLNSFNNTQIADKDILADILKRDLSRAVGTDIQVTLYDLETAQLMTHPIQEGECLDALDISCDTFSVNPNLLSCQETETEEVLYSHLLKSNCLVTGQPDWGTVIIRYKGKQIDKESLLKYIVSFRNHNEFHEQCVERIFMDVRKHCQPEYLTVEARYTRRGGLDINPYRTSDLETKSLPAFQRTIRQ